MDHDQRVCPRCGEPAGDYRFCQSCSSHIDSLTGTAPGAGAHASDPSHSAPQVLREVLRLEQALAAASKGISDRIATGPSATAVQADSDPLSGGNRDASAGALERAKLPMTADERGSDAVQGPREVARFEDVLTVASSGDDDPIAPKTAAAVPDVAPAQNDTDGAADDTSAGVSERAKGEVARLEQLLTVVSTDDDTGIAA
jgi:hypothetical protein